MKREIKFRAWTGLIMLHDGFAIMNGKVLHHNVGGLEFYGEYEYEIMQFTGLLDKNGKEIYEGDIINANIYLNEQDCHDIYFQNGDFRIRWSMFRLSELLESSFNGRKVEVIGNIYENPELL